MTSFRGITVILLIVSAVLSSAISQTAAKKQKVMYVDSYHAGYPWSAGITKGIRSVLGSRRDMELQIIRMDTKRNIAESFKIEAGLKAKAAIDDWNPDIVIASDDNASKYLVAPFYKDADLPFVFCGVNWDSTVYGYPFENVTGMVEVLLTKELVEQLKRYSKGERIGFLAPDMTSTRQIIAYNKKILNIQPSKIRFVNQMEQWKAAYQELQGSVDLLLITPWQGIPDWDEEEMTAFAQAHARIPSGTFYDYLAKYSLVCFATDPEEQGEWAAETALDILGGKSPRDIPITTNKRAKIILNMKIAKRTGVKFPVELIESAHLISAEPRRVLFVNSYHKGYFWSDNIEMGLKKALSARIKPNGTIGSAVNNLVVRFVRMDTKLNRSEAFKEKAALSVKAVIEQWKPDIVVASDDNASKYLIAPYYRNGSTPFVFCGLNHDASDYGFPCSNITGLVEREPIAETIALMTQYAKGERIGYISDNTLSSEKVLSRYKDKMNLRFSDGGLVDNFDQWKQLFLRLQNTTDMVIFMGKEGVHGWDDAEAVRFIKAHVKIPVGSAGDYNMPYSMFGRVNVAEEQGWEAGKIALRILDGESPEIIPVRPNRGSRLMVNMELVNALGIKLPVEILQNAVFVGGPVLSR